MPPTVTHADIITTLHESLRPACVSPCCVAHPSSAVHRLAYVIRPAHHTAATGSNRSASHRLTSAIAAPSASMRVMPPSYSRTAARSLHSSSTCASACPYRIAMVRTCSFTKLKPLIATCDASDVAASQHQRATTASTSAQRCPSACVPLRETSSRRPMHQLRALSVALPRTSSSQASCRRFLRCHHASKHACGWALLVMPALCCVRLEGIVTETALQHADHARSHPESRIHACTSLQRPQCASLSERCLHRLHRAIAQHAVGAVICVVALGSRHCFQLSEPTFDCFTSVTHASPPTSTIPHSSRSSAYVLRINPMSVSNNHSSRTSSVTPNLLAPVARCVRPSECDCCSRRELRAGSSSAA